MMFNKFIQIINNEKTTTQNTLNFKMIVFFIKGGFVLKPGCDGSCFTVITNMY